MGPFYWLGGIPGAPLPKIDYANAKRPTCNKAGERPTRKNHFEVPGADFREWLASNCHHSMRTPGKPALSDASGSVGIHPP